ncbi:MAG: PorV/PorQ family protein [Candidatus Eisenbacteria bacterium]|uniref:PorV/PorQ family protein n=1 Tax=Eiseniibacteriota bacterium TaxID=2212470 RepID=A0A933W875_UNCEI|nr:PorV/PorQ family protein [Candidatus Eisenbacteria bacterium]
MHSILRGIGSTAAALVLLGWAESGSAQSNTGTTFGAFSMIEPSARVAAMGNAGVALFEGLTAAYYNPAAIGGIRNAQVVFSHNAWIADIRHDYVATAIPLGGWGTAFASATSLNSGDIPVRTVEQPLGTGELFQVSDVAISLGYGRQISQRFSAGLQVNYLQETIWHTSASAMTLSIGTLYRVSENGLRIGSSLTNFGTRASFDGRDLRFTYDNIPGQNGDNSSLPGIRYTDAFSVPVLFRVGLGMPYKVGHDGRLLLEADAFHPNDNSESMSLGAEYAMREVVAVRAGWQGLFLEDSEVGLTLGAGVNGRFEGYRYRCDYGWADQGRLGSTHRVTVGIGF